MPTKLEETGKKKRDAMKINNSFFGAKKEFIKSERKAFAREDLIYNVTEDILVAMEDLGVSKKALAYKLGKSKSYVTQILSGARNMTLGSLSDICFVLDIEPKVTIDSTSCIMPKPNNNIHAWVDVEVKDPAPKKTNGEIRLVYDRGEGNLWEGANQAA